MGRAGKAGAETVTAPHDTPYGPREFTCRDPEHNLRTIGSYGGEPLT